MPSCRCSCSSLISSTLSARQLVEDLRGLARASRPAARRTRRTRARSARAARPPSRSAPGSRRRSARRPPRGAGGRGARRRSRPPLRGRRRTSPPPRRGRRCPRRPGSSSTTEPFSASTIESAGTPASCARRACAASMRYSPWTGITALRAEQREDRSQLLGVRVAGDVHGRVLLVQHLGAGLREPVDRVVDAQLVSGHRLGRDDHGVAALDVTRPDGRCRRSGSARRAARPGCPCRGSAARAARSSSSSFGRIIVSSGTST